MKLSPRLAAAHKAISPLKKVSHLVALHPNYICVTKRKNMTQLERQKLATKVNGLLGTGTLNWLGDFDMETKKEQFSIFFNKESMARKALSMLPELNAKIVKTPKFVNVYFKFSVTILL